MSFLISEAVAPSTPSANKVAVYAKSDGRVYGKDDAGTEFNMSGITSDTVKTLTGTSVDFTSIPSGVKRITLSFAGLSGNGSSNPLIQLGDSGGIENTGYLGAGIAMSSAATAAANYTTGFGLNSGNTANILHGSIIFTLIDSTTNSWVASGSGGFSNAATAWLTGGSKSLSSTLDRVRMTFVNGTDAYDAGTANIVYE